MRNRRKIRISSVAITILGVMVICFILGNVYLGSQEASLNIDVENTQKEIANLKTEIDALDMEKQKLVTFDRVENLAVEKGYTYKHNTTTALAIGVNKD